MKQGTAFIKFILLILLVALILYGVGAFVHSLRTEAKTVTAISYEVGDGFEATGFLVREEQAIIAPQGISMVIPAEGAKVAKDETIASTFADTTAKQTQEHMNEVQKTLAGYETALDSQDTAHTKRDWDTQIQQEMTHMAVKIAAGNLTVVNGAADDLKTQVISRFLDESGSKNMEAQAQLLREELAELRSKLVGMVTQTNAPVSGYFSTVCDGLESVLTPQTVMELTPGELRTIENQNVIVQENLLGRMITSTQWYYVCLVPRERLEDFQVGDRLKVSLALDNTQPLSMRIVRISEPEDGQQVLVLSYSNYLNEISRVRTQSAEITMHSYTGLRIPKKALCYDNEKKTAGVFVLQGAQAVWKSVTPVYEDEEYYLVAQDSASTQALWPGDEIILDTQNLTNHKVVNYDGTI